MRKPNLKVISHEMLRTSLNMVKKDGGIKTSLIMSGEGYTISNLTINPKYRKYIIYEELMICTGHEGEIFRIPKSPSGYLVREDLAPIVIQGMTNEAIKTLIQDVNQLIKIIRPLTTGNEIQRNNRVVKKLALIFKDFRGYRHE